MKKVLLILSFLTLNSLYALPVGNPMEPALLCEGWFCKSNSENYCDRCEIDPCYCWCDQVSFRFGFYGDYVFNRHLCGSEKINSSEIETTKIFTNAGYFALNFCDRVDFFTTLGMTNFALHYFFNPTDVSDGSVAVDLKIPSHFSWSVGMRAILCEWGCWVIGAEAQYFQTHPTISTLNAIEDIAVDHPKNAHFDYREGEVGIGIARRFGCVAPYIALKWSKATVRCKRTFNIEGLDFPVPDLKNCKSVGYAIGASLIRYEKIALTAEGRFADEKALYINAQVRF